MLDINNNRIKIIIGYNKDEKTILFYELDNSRSHFSMCADIGELINCDDISNDDVEDYLMDCDNIIFDIMKKYHLRSIDDAIELIINESGAPYRVIYDCSCTDYEIYHDGITYNFNTVSCGQCCDEINNFKLLDDRFILFFNTWTDYHLKQAPEKTIKKINDLLNLPEIQKYIFDIDNVLEDLFFNEKK